MRSIKLKLEALEPLIITNGSAEGNSHESLKYIPANMLLGARAFAWRNLKHLECGDDNEEFRLFFLSAAVKWGHAYPQINDVQTVPIPLCYQKIKNYSALPTVGMHNAQKSRVINLSALKLENDETLRACLPDGWLHKKDDAVKLKKLEQGFMCVPQLCMPNLASSYQMHAAINKDREAQLTKLFGYQALNKGSSFISEIFCPDSLTSSLKDLILKVSEFSIGHGRNSGYGKVRAVILSDELYTAPKEPSQNICKLFLLSDYISRNSWQEPLLSLQEELERYFIDLKIDFESLSCLYDDLLSFSGQWKLPRRTRKIIAKGSVIKFSHQGLKQSLPLALGGFSLEGYGRYLIDPDFLNEPFLYPQDIDNQIKSSAKKSVNGLNGNLIHVLRIRALLRQSLQDAQLFTEDESIAKFISSQSNESSLSASQRGNLRLLVNMLPQNQWLSKFEDILDKTPKAQWHNSSGASPFDEGHKLELSDIVKKFLDKQSFVERFLANRRSELKLIGGDISNSEWELYIKEFHRHALLNLIKLWDMKAKRG